MMIIIMLNLFNKVNTYAIIHLNYDKMTKKNSCLKNNVDSMDFLDLHWTQKKNK